MRGPVVALLWAVPLLRASDVCAERILSDGTATMDELECVRAAKLCLQAGMCADAGISTARLCECYRQVTAAASVAARRGAACRGAARTQRARGAVAQVRLPLSGRALTDYECRATARAEFTILEEWRACQRIGRADEL